MALLREAPLAVEGSGDTPAGDGFRLRLDVFEGPFDLLLTLITRRELDITDVSLSAVTDEFIAYLSRVDADKELDAATEFLLVAATLLDLKIAGLLPGGEVVDTDDIALLEARDLLFARLLQYRAFKTASAWIAERLSMEASRHARAVPLDVRYRSQPRELRWTLSAQDFAALAMMAFAPADDPVVSLEHLHAPVVSIREQAAHIVGLLRGGRPLAFRELIAGIAEKGVIIARFLAVLELYRQSAVVFEQNEPLGDVTVNWVANEWTSHDLTALGADFDDD